MTSSAPSRPSSTAGTNAANHSPGPRPPTRSSRKPPAVKDHRSRDTRSLWRGGAVDGVNDGPSQLQVFASPSLGFLVVLGVNKLTQGVELIPAEEAGHYVSRDVSTDFDRLDGERDGTIPRHLGSSRASQRAV